jgi:hypothetical protein
VVSQESVDLFIDVLKQEYNRTTNGIAHLTLDLVAEDLGARLERDYTGFKEREIWNRYVNHIRNEEAS